MTDALNPIPSDQLRITVEAGDDCRTTPRIAAALQELRSALEEADNTDVEGFLDLANCLVSSYSWAASNPATGGTGYIEKAPMAVPKSPIFKF